MKTSDIEEVIKSQFQFLETDYDFRLEESKKELENIFKYKNRTTGVLIEYEFKLAYILITLYRLIDSEIILNPVVIKKNSILNGYGLDDIIYLKNASALIKPAYEYGLDSPYYDRVNGLSLYVSKFADNLKTYAADVLMGDFSIFSETDKIVKTRLR